MAERTIIIKDSVEEKRVDVVLSEEIKEISRSEIKKNIISGNLKVNGETVKRQVLK